MKTLFAGAAAVLVVNLGPFAAGSGTAEVKTILGGFIIRGFLGIQTLVIKAAALPLTVASGLAVGKEGPMIHVASAVGNILQRFFSKFRHNEAAAAAGVAVAFGCNDLIFRQGLSGAIFIRLSQYAQAYRQKLWTKDKPILEVLIIAAGTAVVCYLNGFTRVDSSELLEYLFKECTESEFNGLCDKGGNWWKILSLSFALIIRLCLTIVSISVKVPAGIFIPSMVWGALFGRVVGIMVQSWQQNQPELHFFSECHPDVLCVTPGMYALLGAIAALGGVTRLTVSLTVVMFELTGTLNYIIPCMITLMVAKLSGDAFGKGGVTDVQIQRRKLPFLDGTEDMIVGSPAFELMTPVEELTILREEGMPLSELEQVVMESDYKGYPIVDNMQERSFVGYVARSDLKMAIVHAKDQEAISDNTRVSFRSHVSRRGRLQEDEEHLPEYRDGVILLTSFVNLTPFSVHPNVQVELVMDMFKKLGPRYIMVLENDRLEGLITKKDLLAALHENEENSNLPFRRSRRRGSDTEDLALIDFESDGDLSSQRQSESSESRTLLGITRSSLKQVYNKFTGS
ncbi:glycerol ethanol, ferric requiring protein [Phlyctochytrium planicorne]|nr:glycerol ethanol, ferric requiring protein [Phlyctochytrium planicorne]